MRSQSASLHHSLQNIILLLLTRVELDLTWGKLYLSISMVHGTIPQYEFKTVFPGAAKPSLPLHSKIMDILAPFTATRAILLVQPHNSAQVFPYNREILSKILIIRSCMLVFLKCTM
jgi:hypothetical protein